jgi:zinc protease
MGIDRSIKPSATSGISYKGPDYESLTLDKNLDVHFIKKDTLPIIRAHIIINAGSIFEPNEKKGISNLLSRCIDEGAGEYDSLELSEQFDLLGAQFSIHNNSDTIQISLQSLKENFSKALKLVAMILTEPHFKQKDFEREKRNVLTKLKQLNDDPDYLASTSFKYHLFGEKNPYSFPVIGLNKDITRVTNKEVISFYNQYILPGNSFMIIVGDVSKAILKRNLNKIFSSWSSDLCDIRFESTEKSDEKVVYIVDKKDSVQTEIRTGHHATGRNAEDYFAKHMLNTILGGQFTSRINLNLREKHGYTYGAGSNFNYYKNNAYFAVSTSVGMENTANALNEIFKELERLSDGITDEELEFAKSSIIRKFPLNFETYGQVASNFIGKVIYDLPADYFDTYIDNINSITVEDVNKAAIDNISPNLATTVLVGDKTKIISQLEDHDFGDVVVVEKM